MYTVTYTARVLRSAVRAALGHTFVKLAAVAVLSAAYSPLAAQSRDSTVQDSSANARKAHPIEGVMVRAIRSTDQPPIAQTTVDRETILKRNFGQDVPLLLQGASPSLTAHTETGTNWGYSYLRLRGLDQTRINITVDGVPLNDMEDQVLYFANFADLLAGVRSVQVQRGVGTSSNGTASFAGSVNLETMPVARRKQEGRVTVQAGSFGAQRVSGEYSSGLHNRFAMYARAGALRTNGYRDHSGVEGRSLLAGGGYFGDKHLVKFTLLAGMMADTLSYVGATLDELAVNRRHNPLHSEERDRFAQQMVALTWTNLRSATSSFTTTVYRNSAKGRYDYFYDTDRYQYGLAHTWYGATAAVNREVFAGRGRLNSGVNVNSYEREHSAFFRPDPVSLYANVGHKQDASAFAKLSYDATDRTRVYGDLQLRHARFRYEPDSRAGITEREVSWTFVNPRAGMTFQANRHWSAFASFGTTGREPARSDMFAGEDDMNEFNVGDIGDLTRVKAERVYDTEAGLTFRGGRVEATGNVYHMAFRNDIAPIGTPTASGSIPRRNVGSSIRRGIELDARFIPVPSLSLSMNFTVSDNVIAKFTDSTASAPRVFENVRPMLAPSLLSAQRVGWQVTPLLSFAAEGRYQSKAQLDNTGSDAHVLPDFYVLDASARVELNKGAYALTVRGTNLGDTRKYGSGNVSSDGVSRYFVLPPRTLFISLEAGF